MIHRPKFKAKYHIENVPDVGIFLLAEGERHVLEGFQFQHIVPLVDGRRTWQEIIALAMAHMTEQDAQATVNVLLQNGHVLEQDDNMLPQFETYWSQLGRNSSQATDLVTAANIHFRTFGEVDAAPFAAALQSFGFSSNLAKPASLIIALADDYQYPALGDINSHCLANGIPWVLVKPSGMRQLMGPIFVPGRTACWQCLEARLRHNREVESYIQRKTGRAEPYPVCRTRIPLAEQKLAHELTLQLVRWLALGNHPELESTIASSDLFSLGRSYHYVLRRPQCAACGDPALEGMAGRPVQLASHPATGASENGSRLEPPEVTFQRYAHHVSDLTGIVKGIVPSEWNGVGPLRVYMAGHNFALNSDRLLFLKDGLRTLSAGKGRTDAQARTSALCEALERYSGLHRGGETKITASFRQMGAKAVDPRSVMLYSGRQYAEREQWMARGSRFQAVPMPLDEDAEISWSPLWSWSGGCVKYLPTSSLYYGFSDGGERFYAWSDSNGNAAGGSLEDAVLQGFLELVERDSVAIWWYNRIPRPEVDLAALDDPYFADLKQYYAGFGREFWVLDLTADLGIPAYAAINRRVGHPVEDIILGFGAHLDPRVAVNRAVTEMNQFIPAVLARGQDGNTLYSFDDPDALRWWKTATLENQPYLRPSGPARRLDGTRPGPAPDIKDQVAQCFAAVEQLGLEVLILDQTRPDVGLPVVKVVVPGLRHFWARFAPGRLYDVPVKLGWLAAATAEEDLNPIPMFI